MKHIIHKVKSWIGGGKATDQHTALVYVLVNAKRAAHTELCAADPGAVIRRLVSFSSREALPLSVILPGKPNKRYPDGSRQNGVMIRYATPDQLLKVTELTVKETSRDQSVVLITDSPILEKYAAAHHFKTLRLDTFDKALESVAGPLKRETRRPQEQAAPRQPAPAEGTPPAEPQKPAERPPAQKPPQQAPAPKPAAVPEKKDRDQAILDLIDPL